MFSLENVGMPRGDSSIASSRSSGKVAAKAANGSVVLPLIVVPSTQDQSTEPFKLNYPLFIRYDGLSNAGTQLTNTTGDPASDGTDMVFYGIPVSYGKLAKRRRNGTNPLRLAHRVDVCLRGVYDAPQSWLMKNITGDDGNVMFSPYTNNSGFVVFNKELGVPYCVTEREYRDSMSRGGSSLVSLGQFFSHVTDRKNTNVKTLLTMYQAIVHGDEKLRNGKSQRQRRMERRRFKVFLRC